ncbi:MAG: hypothetical protein IJO81_04505 [Clostridia bacterium]|nr:hypothetical protein [Clostridia bacterium]
MNLPLNIDLLQILLHMLNFVILAGGLYLLLYSPICKFIDGRQKAFEEAEERNRLTEEENLRLKNEYLLKISSAEAEIAEKKKAAEKEWADTSAAYIREAREKADAIIRAAETEAEDRKEHILESVQTELGELVIGAAHKLVSDTVTPERDCALYDEFIRLADEKLAEEKASHRKTDHKA